MDEEKIIIDIPSLSEGNDKSNKRVHRPAAVAAAALLITVSVALHGIIAVEAVSYLKKRGEGLLLSFVMPDSKISEPKEPPLPEGSALDRGEEDKQEDFLSFNKDLSSKAEYGLALTNETSYNPDLYYLLGTDPPGEKKESLDKAYGTDAPKVLLYHTHATEAYRDTYSTGFRTDDSAKNTVAVGEVIKNVLEKAGITTVHLTEQFDIADWSSAYDNSSKAVLEILEKHPSIEYVFDIHRDCIGNDESGYIRPVFNTERGNAAQLMFVCGTDEGGSGHTQWRSNLSFALRLQELMFSKNSSSVRPINLRRASFYQDCSPTSLILECGSCANSLSEAKRAAVFFAVSLCDYIYGEPCGLDTRALWDSLCP